MVSIIIVNYHVKKEVFVCIESIIASKSKTGYEIIVVDNDENKKIKKELQKKLPTVIYIPNKNKGFGEGNNKGANIAKGNYLFFLNPDTKLLNNCIDYLTKFLDTHKNTGIVSPLLFNKDNKPYLLQGVRELTPVRAIFALSFVKKLFPNNKIYRDYYFQDWDKKNIKEVDVVPGTALVMRKEVFEKLGGFDEKFFLYFEEFDLCKRVKSLGWKIYLLPNAKIFHSWGSSTKEINTTGQIFQKSRYYYLRKHFGLFQALVTEGVIRINKNICLLLGILVIATVLRVNDIYNTMPFIGDQGWFYISARDMLLTGKIPLVGIESSHPWIHQGAYWTYLLALWLRLFSFNPVVPAYLTTLIDIISILILYKFTSEFFSQRTGLIAAALYATSPIVVMNSRIPYHTSPIPLFVILYVYALYKWIHGKKYFFPVMIFSLAFLYNLELVTFLLSFFTGAIFLFGLIKKKHWASSILDKKTLLFSFLIFLLGMLPMLIYDINHGFPQTIKFLVWIGYRILVFFGYPEIHPALHASFTDMTRFFTAFFQKLLFFPSEELALLLFASCFIFISLVITKKPRNNNIVLLYWINVFLTSVIFLTKTPSEAYLTLLFPFSIILIAICFDKAILHKLSRFIFVGILCIILGSNIYSLYNSHYSFVPVANALPTRIAIAKFIVKQSQGKEYNLVTQGKDKQSTNFSMNYEYLTWWLGHPPSHLKQRLLFIVEENLQDIKVKKEIKN